MLNTFQKDSVGFGDEAVMIDAVVAIRQDLPEELYKMSDQFHEDFMDDFISGSKSQSHWAKQRLSLRQQSHL
jgi:hypothetical protein